MPRGNPYDRKITPPKKAPARGATTSRPTTSRSSMSEPAPRRMTADERRANATRKEQPKVSVRPAPSAYTDVSPAPKTRPKTPPVAPSSRSSVTVPRPSVDRSVNIPKPSVPAPKSPAKFGKTDSNLVGVERTKGGDYNIYKRGSEEAKSFQKAYAEAKPGVFTWQGRKYRKP